MVKTGTPFDALTSPVSFVLQHELFSGWRLQKRKSALWVLVPQLLLEVFWHSGALQIGLLLLLLFVFYIYVWYLLAALDKCSKFIG